MFTRRTRLGSGESNLSLDVQRSRGCGYECRARGNQRSLGVKPLWPIAFTFIGNAEHFVSVFSLSTLED